MFVYLNYGPGVDSASNRNEYQEYFLTTQSGQTSLYQVGFEPTISAGERPQTHALDRGATGTGNIGNVRSRNSWDFTPISSFRHLKFV